MVSALTLEQTGAESNAVATQTNGIDPHEVKFQFPRQGEWTYEHWLQFPNDSWTYEILDGILYMSPPPTINHQDVSGELFARMRIFARDHTLGTVLEAPCGVRLPTQPVPVAPDIFFVRRERQHIIEERYVEGAPDLVVEILSRSTVTSQVLAGFQIAVADLFDLA